MGIQEEILSSKEYRYGFSTRVDSDVFAKGLDEEVVRSISSKRCEPKFLLDFRLKALAKWRTMKEPRWAHVQYPPIDYQGISYFSEPKSKPRLESLDEVDPEILSTFERLGIPLDEQKRLANVAIDVVFDSVSLGTTFQKKLKEAGVDSLFDVGSGSDVSRDDREIFGVGRSDRR